MSQLACIERLLVGYDITASNPMLACLTAALRPREAEEVEVLEPFREVVERLL